MKTTTWGGLLGAMLLGACGSPSSDNVDQADNDTDDVAPPDAPAPDAPAPDAPAPDAPAPVCGNGVVEFGEECDSDNDLCTDCVSTPVAFAFTGAPETFTVPAGVTALRFTLTGASGGDSLSPEGEYSADGGFGAVVTATVAVKPGDALSLRVGSDGELVAFGDFEGVNAGGYNGGGAGGHFGGAGGGATDVRFAGDGLEHRILVAGGGGGGNTGSPDAGTGGDAGADGGDGVGLLRASPGRGGTQLAGGAAGENGTAGTLGVGATYFPQFGPFHSAGGGGGYYGGGSAYAAGAGAGSSFVPEDATDVEISTALARGDGSLTISLP